MTFMRAINIAYGIRSGLTVVIVAGYLVAASCGVVDLPPPAR